MSESEFEPEVSVNVAAIRSEEYDKGYADGIVEGARVGGQSGYKSGVLDLIGRLKASEHFTQESHGVCLAIINDVARSMAGIDPTEV